MMRLAPLLVAVLILSCDAGSREAAKGKPAEPTGKTTTQADSQPGKPPPKDAPEPKPMEGSPAPALDAAAWVNSDPLTLAALKGKVVLLDFWGFFCAPCRKLSPHLNELYGRHRAEGLVVIGVSEDEKADIEKFAKDYKLSYPLAADRLVNGDGQTLKAYGIVEIPTVYLVGRTGRIAWKGHGEKLADKSVLDELARKH